MSAAFDLLSQRRADSTRRLKEVQSSIGEFDRLTELSDLCIYVTGSYGRLEASPNSDLDLFFINKGSDEKNRIPATTKTLLDAHLIRAIKTLGLPDFSNDGKYLSVHYLDDMKTTLGSSDDDFENRFTARLLLLLESQPLYNDDVYQHVLEEVIGSYFRDYPDNAAAFHPLFLINDILRFWRTLCLNYEHRRKPSENDPSQQSKSHLLNLKLKFSRLLICHSAIALLSIPPTVSPDEVFRIVQLSPLERLDDIATQRPATTDTVSAMKDVYSWFLYLTGRPTLDAQEWIAKSENRETAFDKGGQFATQMYDILREATADSGTMRYLVV